MLPLWLTILVISTLFTCYISPSTRTKYDRLASMHPKHTYSNLIYLIVLICFLVPKVDAMPTRSGRGNRSSAPASSSSAPIGSDSYPYMIRDWDFLPGMKRWNGQPFFDFARVLWVALIVALEP